MEEALKSCATSADVGGMDHGENIIFMTVPSRKRGTVPCLRCFIVSISLDNVCEMLVLA